MLTDTGADAEACRIDVDRLERPYRLVYPLKIFLENARQVSLASAVVLIVGAAVYFLQYVTSSTNEAPPIEIQVFLVTAFAIFLVIGYISLWALTVRNYWKFGALLTLVLALVFAWSLYGTGMAAASPAVEIFKRLMTVARTSGVLLLAVIGFALAYYAHVIGALLAAAFGLAAVKASDRKVLRDRPSRKAKQAGFFSRFWAFPPLFKFARNSFWRYAAIIVLSVTCALLFSAAAVLPILMKAPLEDIPSLIEKCPADAGCIELTKVARWLDNFVFLFEALLVCLLFGWLCQLLLRRLLRFSLKALEEVDTRPPVLFLRAFRDDQVPLREPKIALFGRLLEMGRRQNSLDQLLLEEGTPSGPVVGLGSPSDKRPPYGAARGYFTNETWQQVVVDLAANAVLIVICIDDTAGVWWEVEHLVARHLDKTLFLIHPRYASAGENMAILGRFSRHFADGKEAAPPRSAAPEASGRPRTQAVIGFFRDQEGSFRVLETSTFSRFAYLLALRVFIRQEPGFPILPPAKAEAAQAGHL